jgi:hypothetical protein
MIELVAMAVSRGWGSPAKLLTIDPKVLPTFPRSVVYRGRINYVDAIDRKILAALQDDVLAALPGVQRLNSTLVMKQVVQDGPLPA